jgi:hypothetical protein
MEAQNVTILSMDLHVACQPYAPDGAWRNFPEANANMWLSRILPSRNIVPVIGMLCHE